MFVWMYICVVVGSFLVSVFSSLLFLCFFLIRESLLFLSQHNTPSKGCSKTSASSKGSSETSLDSTPSDPNSALMFFRDPLSCNRDRAAPAASNIGGHVVKVLCDIKGQEWLGSWGMLGDGPGHELV